MPNAQSLNALGLVLTVAGAIVSASGVVLSPKTAAAMAATRWDSNQDLEAALLKQSRRAAFGLMLVASGAVLQLVSIFAI